MPVNTRGGATFSALHAAIAAMKGEHTMMMRLPRKLALIAGLAIAFGGMAYTQPAAAQVHVGVGIGIGIAPPPPRVERLPPPRAGFVWAPGYWRWNARWHRHVWVTGHWVRVRRGYHYRPAHWQRGPRGQWHFRPGHWVR
ncbi:hypothetical protein [Dyella sp. A6]|uniref:hypothetical protein n=1 Tax=Dyella aluminiiresistens TaxID=3069105 RepID=UPI002E784B1F|nr:hypothetical protein [Dyella sp. A6]